MSSLDTRRHRRRARAEASLLHVEIDGAPDGSVHVGRGLPAQVALRGLDVRHAYLDVLVVLAVVLARGNVHDLSGACGLAQHRELLRDPDGALGQLTDGDAVAGVADVENAPAGAVVLVLEYGQQSFDGVFDVSERA